MPEGIAALLLAGPRDPASLPLSVALCPLGVMGLGATIEAVRETPGSDVDRKPGTSLLRNVRVKVVRDGASVLGT